MTILQQFVVTVLAFGVSYKGVAVVRRWSERKGILLDIPNERSSHSVPVPRGGGVGIVLVTLGGGAVILLANSKEACVFWLPYLLGALLIALVGWLDDLYSLPSGLRLGVHTLGAGLLLVGVGYWQAIELPYIGHIGLNGWGIPLTLFWVVGLTNAYNFMDGIDGLAGGQAVVAGLGWVVVGGWISPQIREIGLLLVASALGFLIHNWHPARVFMGDVGATFLGFSFAALTIVAGRYDPRLVTVGAVFVWPFIFDATFTFIRRLCRKENVFVAHRTHLYQRLVASGYRHDAIALLYIGLAVIGAVWAVLWWLNVAWAGPGLLFSLFVMGGALVVGTIWSEKRAR